MAASSSSLNLLYDVFVSYRRVDVRKSLRSHLVKELSQKLITVFNDIEIERSDSMWLMIVQAIKNSRIAVVIFSINYASSSWCLNELLEIVNCKDKIVIPIFYGLQPFHVREQRGYFGEKFKKTFKQNTEEVINLWRKALTDVASILGFHSAKWDDEAKMIEEIANVVLGKLLSTSSKNFVDFVGIQDHIAKMSLLLQLQSEEVRMIGIYGSSGIGKITIARALFNQLSRHFQVTKFINKSFVSRSKIFYSGANSDDQNMKLHLQGRFLTEILGIDIKIDHLGALEERLKHKKVLIIIDDLDDQIVLDSLVAQPQWFGSGSRVIVITNAKHFLTAHRIHHIHEVNFPTEEHAVHMLCQSPFRTRFMKFFSSMWGSSMVKELQPQHKVFINFRGAEVGHGFVSHLLRALVRNNIYVFMDREVGTGQELKVNLKRKIEGSKIALVIFSRAYTQSTWCLTELAMITECVEKGHLVAIPIFFNLNPSTVRDLQEQFGSEFMDLRETDATKEKWKKALMLITNRKGIIADSIKDESEMIDEIVEEVQRELKKIALKESQKASSEDPSEKIDTGKYGIKQHLRVLGEKIDTGIYGIKQSFKELGDKLDLSKIRSHPGMLIACLLLLFSCVQHIVYTSTPLLGEGSGVINRIVVDIPKVLEYIPPERTEIKEDKIPTGEYGSKPVRSSSSDAKMNANFLDRTLTNTIMDIIVKPPQIQVFINFRGVQLRNNFVGYLVHALRKAEVNVFIDNYEKRGEDLNTLFKRIEDSGIAIVVFSTRYTESKWCLEELVKIKERVTQGLLKVLPIFYKVSPTDVKRLKGKFGDNFRDQEDRYGYDSPLIKAWKQAIEFVTKKHALVFDEKSRELEVDFVETIVKDVLEMLQSISIVESGQSSHQLS